MRTTKPNDRTANVSPGPERTGIEGRRFFLRIPRGWAAMSEAARKVAALAMARDAQRQLGIEPPTTSATDNQVGAGCVPTSSGDSARRSGDDRSSLAAFNPSAA